MGVGAIVTFGSISGSVYSDEYSDRLINLTVWVVSCAWHAAPRFFFRISERVLVFETALYSWEVSLLRRWPLAQGRIWTQNPLGLQVWIYGGCFEVLWSFRSLRYFTLPT